MPDQSGIAVFIPHCLQERLFFRLNFFEAVGNIRHQLPGLFALHDLPGLLHLDVADNESVAAAVRKVKRKYGALDFLINNAGVGNFIPFQKQTAEEMI